MWDFGCSKREFTQGHQPPLSPYHRPFVAPELLDAELPFATRQSDIYSLAAAVWFLGRSQPSWGFPDDVRGARAMVYQMRPPLPFDIPGGLTNDDTRPLWDVIRSMLSDDPRLRPTISDVRNELMRSGLIPRPPQQPTAHDPICLPRHLCSSHSEYFRGVSPAGMRSIRAALDGRHFFRSALLDLPPIELSPVVEGLQAVCRIPMRKHGVSLCSRLTYAPVFLLYSVHRSLLCSWGCRKREIETPRGHLLNFPTISRILLA